MLEVAVIFGTEAVKSFTDSGKISSDAWGALEVFTFSTIAEIEAFKQGLDAAVGWHECYVLDERELQKLKSEAEE